VLRIDPHEIASGQRQFHFDFITLTKANSVKAGTPFQLTYQTTPATGVTVTFYYDTDTNPANGRTVMGQYAGGQQQGAKKVFMPMVLGGGPVPEINLMAGSNWTWNSAVAPGTYYASADVNDGVMTTTWYSEVPVIVTP
jgi:hypothetical protein